MRGLGATILLVGAGGLLMPLFGIQFKLVRAVAEAFHLATPAASAILAALGFLLIFVDAALRTPRSTPGGGTRLERRLARAGPTLDEILANRPQALSQEAVAKIFPFYGEITRRNLREKPSEVDKDVAPRAGVTEDELVLFHSAVFNIMMQKQRNKK